MTHLATTTSKPADLSRLKALTSADLARVNSTILEYAKSDIALVEQLAAHIIAAGGKRLRPCLTLAAAKLCGYAGDRHIRLAACIEFIHTATLLHDDVVDASDLRRGEATANALWGNKSSVLVGDFLFSRAFQLMVADGSLDVLRILSNTSAIIASGEVHQLMVSHDLAITRQTYEQVIGAKTAALFAAACEVGAVVADKPEYQAALRDYGYALGMAFQIVDDALDYQAIEAELGKAIGDDFRDGKVTLPVLFAYQAANEEEKQFWEEALASEASLTPDALKHARQYMLRTGAFEKTIQVAQHFVNVAHEALATLPDSEEKQALSEAADFALHRHY